MQSLKDFVTAFHRELDSAISQPTTSELGIRFQAERITLSLNLDIIETPKGDGKAGIQIGVASPTSIEKRKGTSGSTEKEPHRLTIEFKPVPPLDRTSLNSPNENCYELVQQKEVPGDGVEHDRVIERLSHLFGAPGFDSSARATVFRESLDGMSPRQTETLLSALTANTHDGKDLSIKSAFKRIQKIFKAGPVCSPQKGGLLLGELVHQYSVPSLIEFIKETWKEQADWLG